MKRAIILIIITLVVFSACKSHETGYSDSSLSQDSAVENASILSEDDSGENISDPTAESSESDAVSIESIADFNYDSMKNFNKNSGGYVLEINDTYYYSNTNDNNCLYKKTFGESAMTEKVGELESDYLLTNLQYSQERLFYVRTSKSEDPVETDYATVVFSKEIICYDFVTEKETVLLNSQPIVDYVVCNDYVYYTTFNETNGGELFCFSLSDRSQAKLSEFNYPMTVQEHGNKLYLGFDELLAVYDINSGAVSNHMLIHSGFAVRGDAIYYLDSDDFCLYKIQYNIDINDYNYESAEKLSEISASSFSMYGDNIIISNFDDGGLIYIDSSVGEEREIAKGSFPIVTSRGVFYRTDDGLVEFFEFD